MALVNGMDCILPRHKLDIRALLLAVALHICLVPVGSADPVVTAEEYALKAAFLYRFTNFIQWPEDRARQDVFQICLLGRDSFGAVITALEQETVQGKHIQVKEIQGLDPELDCHVVYISTSEIQNRDRWLDRLSTLTGVLTVSDMEGFARAGGVVQFIQVENRVRFAINVEAAERTKLTVSSKLLRLSKPLEEAP